MTIQPTPEDEELIRKRLSSVEEVIHDALASQDYESDWLAANWDAIEQTIARASRSSSAAKVFRGT